MSHRSLVLAVALLLGVGCEAGPEPIRYGREACAMCRMRIADQRFGSELVTVRGKVYKFDAVECLVVFSERGDVAAGDIHSLWVSDFATPGQLIDARTARYLRTDAVHSPMGLNALAFSAPGDLEASRQQYQGEILAWEQLRPLARLAHERWSPRASPALPPARP